MSGQRWPFCSSSAMSRSNPGITKLAYNCGEYKNDLNIRTEFIAKTAATPSAGGTHLPRYLDLIAYRMPNPKLIRIEQTEARCAIPGAMSNDLDRNEE